MILTLSSLYFVYILLVTTIQAKENDTQENLFSKTSDYKQVDKTYDYIVVGGGSAGGMAAMRLAKYGFKTLLIEAGPEMDANNYNISIPGLASRASEDPKISYEFFVNYYKESTKLQQNVFYPRVGALGGCSIHNDLAAMYPQNREFDILYQLTGNPVFKEKQFRQKYFKPLEKNQYPLFSNSEDHGSKGWMPISHINVLRLLSFDPHLIPHVAYTAGNPWFDVNGYNKFNRSQLMSEKEGIFNMPGAIDNTNYTRMNYLGQLKFARAFTPLTILTDTLATKILFDDNKKAIGVDVRHGRYLYKASPLFNQTNFDNSIKNQFFANKEIIISAGLFNTPQLLMLSGIGDEQELNKFNIPVISNLKGVGKNLRDKNELSFVLKLPRNLSALHQCNLESNYEKDRCFRNYINHKTGPYIISMGYSGENFKSMKHLEAPDTLIVSAPTYFYKLFKGYVQEAINNNGHYSRLILKGRTKSEGYVKLTSNKPEDVPDINFLKFNIDGKQELNSLINSIQYVRKQAKEHLGNLYKEVFPGSNIKTRKQIAKWILEYTWGHHGCCTAKIGLDDDPMAVLDSKFRVRGVSGLRVMDGSALPEIPAFFPFLFLHMLGNFIADQIYYESIDQWKDFTPKPSEELLKSIHVKHNFTLDPYTLIDDIDDI